MEKEEVEAAADRFRRGDLEELGSTWSVLC
jgi:hypothetical protein